PEGPRGTRRGRAVSTDGRPPDGHGDCTAQTIAGAAVVTKCPSRQCGEGPPARSRQDRSRLHTAGESPAEAQDQSRSREALPCEGEWRFQARPVAPEPHSDEEDPEA